MSDTVKFKGRFRHRYEAIARVLSEKTWRGAELEARYEPHENTDYDKKGKPYVLNSGTHVIVARLCAAEAKFYGISDPDAALVSVRELLAAGAL